MVDHRDSGTHTKFEVRMWSTAKVSFWLFELLRDFAIANPKKQLERERGLQHITKCIFYRSDYPYGITQ